MSVRLPAAKAAKIISMWEALLRKEMPVIRKVAELIGSLVSVYIAVPLGPLYNKQLEIEIIHALKENRGNYDARMSLSSRARQDIEWWIGNVEGSASPIARNDPQKTIWTDASGNDGFGYVDDVGRSGNGLWLGSECDLHINSKELLGAFYGLKALCRDDRDMHIRIMTDNTTCVSYIRDMGGTHSEDGNRIAREIWEWAAERRLWLSAAHIPGTLNVIADKKSRSFDFEKEWMLSKPYFDELLLRFPDLGVGVDLFATRANSQLPQFVSWDPDPEAIAVDAFTLNWSKFDYVYIFPPFSVISRVLAKMRRDGARGLIIVPHWPTQHWFPSLMTMLVGAPVEMGPSPRLLILPGRARKKHGLFKTLKLLACPVLGAASAGKEFMMRTQSIGV